MSGYTACGCRDCFEIAIGEPHALCWECAEAGCEPTTDTDTDTDRGVGRECQRADAYGCEPDEHEHDSVID
jgi:hypothetical protein